MASRVRRRHPVQLRGRRGRHRGRRGGAAPGRPGAADGRRRPAHRGPVLVALLRPARPRLGHPRGAGAGRLGAHRGRPGRPRPGRVEARSSPATRPSLRVATRSGLRREGVRRVDARHRRPRRDREYVVLARLSDDPPLSEPRRRSGRCSTRSCPASARSARCCIRDERRPGAALPAHLQAGLGPARRRRRGRRVAAARRRARGRGGARPATIAAGAAAAHRLAPALGRLGRRLCLVFDGGATTPRCSTGSSSRPARSATPSSAPSSRSRALRRLHRPADRGRARRSRRRRAGGTPRRRPTPVR